MRYYYAEGDQQKGPVEADQLRAAGVRADTLVWREGMGEWQEARAVPQLAGLFAPAAADSHGDPPAYAAAPPAGRASPADPRPEYLPPPAAGPAAYAPQPPLQYGGYAPQVVAPTPPAHGLSVASLVLGIIAIPTTCFYGVGTVLAILAIIFGHIARAQSRRETGHPNGMALAGLICGYVSLAILAVVLLVIFVFVGAAASGSGGRRW